MTMWFVVPKEVALAWDVAENYTTMMKESVLSLRMIDFCRYSSSVVHSKCC